MISNLPYLFVPSIALALLQGLAALPWLAFVDPATFKAQVRKPATVAIFLGAVLGGGVFLTILFTLWQDQEVLLWWGRLYGCILHAQLLADLVALAFFVLLLAWPKGAAVALAAFREGIRQPMFWFFTIFGLVAMIVLPLVPYFTFGEEMKMVLELGYSTIMVCASAFGVLAASMSIAEEIEGRTAVTLMSKPISRRQFLLGKFVGLLLAAFVLTGILSWFFGWVQVFAPALLRETAQAPDWLETWTVFRYKQMQVGTPVYLWRGVAWWLVDAQITAPGVAMGFCQAMVLLAVAVALATRLPMIVNVVSCVVVFILGHLTSILTLVTKKTVPLVGFMAQLFDSVLPSLDFFEVAPVMVRDTPPPLSQFHTYVASVAVYSVMYAAIALLLGLILFEDRDLA